MKSEGNEPPIATSTTPGINEAVQDFKEYQGLRDNADLRSWYADRLHDDLGYALRLLGARL